MLGTDTCADEHPWLDAVPGNKSMPLVMHSAGEAVPMIRSTLISRERNLPDNRENTLRKQDDNCEQQRNADYCRGNDD